MGGGRYQLVAIGASWGGLQALSQVLDDMGSGFPVPVVVAQHRHPTEGDGRLPKLLQDHTDMVVQDAQDKQVIEPGNVYIAPADYHLLVEDGAFALSADEVVAFSRPSVDVMFESVADCCSPSVIGVVLTGTNDDGAAGLSRLRKTGAYTVCQNPATAERADMPAAAIAAGACHRVLDLEDIGPFLASVCRPGATT